MEMEAATWFIPPKFGNLPGLGLHSKNVRILGMGIALAALVFWALNGLTSATALLSVAGDLALSLCVILALRKLRANAGLRKQPLGAA